MCINRFDIDPPPQEKMTLKEGLLTLAMLVVVLYMIFDVASNPEHPRENHVRKAQYDG